MQRFAAVCLILVQAFAMVFLMGTISFPLFLTAIACFALSAPRRGWMISLPGDRWVLVLLGLFVLKFYFASTEIAMDYRFILSDFAYEIASFCLVVELLLLFRKENEERIPVSFLAYAVIGFVFTGNVRLSHWRRVGMLLIVQLFLFCWILLSVISRRVANETRLRANVGRYAIMGGVLLVSAVLGSAASVQLYKHERLLEDMIVRYLAIGDSGPARSGFSNRGGLSDVSSWKQYGGNQVALRVDAETTPGYLRGKSFDEFNMDRWAVTMQSEQIRSKSEGNRNVESKNGDYVYYIDEPSDEGGSWITVWPVDNETAGHFFVPLNSSVLTCRSHPVQIDRAKILTRPSETQIVNYSVLLGDQKQQEPLPENIDFLQLPLRLDSRVTETAAELYANKQTAAEKIQATTRFFHQNFLYHMGIRIPPGEDRLGYFLESRSAAHCEYFATATAILLRLGGVPTRYVTGYYTQEQNRFDKSWVARRRDAHAWVEAYDADRGCWVTVESTPGDGVPQPRMTDRWEEHRDSLAHFFRKVQDLVSRGNYTQAIWSFIKPLLWLAAGSGLIAGLTILLKWTVVKPEASAPIVIEVHTDLIGERQKMDRQLGLLGYQRSADETTYHFAVRISEEAFEQAEEFAQWYRDYSMLRFRPGYNSDDVAELRQRRLELASQSHRTMD